LLFSTSLGYCLSKSRNTVLMASPFFHRNQDVLDSLDSYFSSLGAFPDDTFDTLDNLSTLGAPQDTNPNHHDHIDHLDTNPPNVDKLDILPSRLPLLPNLRALPSLLPPLPPARPSRPAPPPPVDPRPTIHMLTRHSTVPDLHSLKSSLASCMQAVDEELTRRSQVSLPCMPASSASYFTLDMFDDPQQPEPDQAAQPPMENLHSNVSTLQHLLCAPSSTSPPNSFHEYSSTPQMPQFSSFFPPSSSCDTSSVAQSVKSAHSVQHVPKSRKGGRKPTTKAPIQTEHGTFRCPYDGCGKDYRYQTNYRSHARLHVNPFVCAICGKKFGRRTNYMGHLNTHSTEKPYQCQICKRPFRDERQLNAHKRVHIM